ncbi:MAG: hypothetical protein V7K26_15550 [Nostoc sp.]|uniref:hypothetical protein n=1 Tax=Nostoc sp. TaxID=1180 RepID=UPI002FF18F13
MTRRCANASFAVRFSFFYLWFSASSYRIGITFADGERLLINNADLDAASVPFPRERTYPAEYTEAIAQIKEQHQQELERLEQELRIGLQAEAGARAEAQVQERLLVNHNPHIKGFMSLFPSKICYGLRNKSLQLRNCGRNAGRLILMVLGGCLWLLLWGTVLLSLRRKFSLTVDYSFSSLTSQFKMAEKRLVGW